MAVNQRLSTAGMNPGDLFDSTSSGTSRRLNVRQIPAVTQPGDHLDRSPDQNVNLRSRANMADEVPTGTGGL